MGAEVCEDWIGTLLSYNQVVTGMVTIRYDCFKFIDLLGIKAGFPSARGLL